MKTTSGELVFLETRASRFHSHSTQRLLFCRVFDLFVAFTEAAEDVLLAQNASFTEDDVYYGTDLMMEYFEYDMEAEQDNTTEDAAP